MRSTPEILRCAQDDNEGVGGGGDHNPQGKVLFLKSDFYIE
jgi:hypothetical protein